ncbi:MAG: DUF4271 domain-containing protein [Cyclobacteriaceae bacterium]
MASTIIYNSKAGLWLLLCLLLTAWNVTAEPVEPGALAKNWQSEYEIIRDFSREWITIDKNNRYVPYIDEGMAEIPVIGVLLDLDRYSGNELIICMPANSSVLLEKQIASFHPEQSCIKMSIDSLRSLYDKEQILISVYEPGRDFEEIGFWIARTKASLASQKVNASMRRTDSPLADFFTLGLLLILVLYAVLINQYPKISSNLYNLRLAFSAKVREEQGRVRLISEAHIMFLIQHCLLFSYLLIIMISVSDMINISLPFLDLQPSTFGGYMVLWGEVAVLVFAAIWLKYIIVMLFGSMFRLKQLRYMYMLDYMRLSLIYSAILFVLLIVVFAGIGMYQAAYFRLLIYFFIGLSVVRVIVLYFRLFSRGAFRNVYLFSYICIAEIVPLLLGIELLLL